MAKPIRIEYGSIGVKTPVRLNHHITPFQVSFETEGGTATVETTLDDINNTNITPVWTTETSPLTSPVFAVRCNLTVGTTVFKVLQAGIK